ncbi:MAG: CDP-alcohol phosphatidyltransferase family protein [Acutalibacteraceae bacterium]|nr:CDP-alcohol phosphatidyltransferase family protein [Acutalibacteraceae bacterium]
MKDLFKGCWTIPNLLSVIRILLIPVFAVLFYREEYGWAILTLVLSGLSDFFDGKIARKFNQISALGKMLDPVADKLTQVTLAVLLFMSFNKAQDETLKAFSWVFLVFIVKEIVMVLGGAVMLACGIRPGAAEIYGKVATFAFYAIMILVIAFGPEVGVFRTVFTLPNILMMILVIISAILTLVAFASYIPGTFRQFKERFSKK